MGGALSRRCLGREKQGEGSAGRRACHAWGRARDCRPRSCRDLHSSAYLCTCSPPRAALAPHTLPLQPGLLEVKRRWLRGSLPLTPPSVGLCRCPHPGKALGRACRWRSRRDTELSVLTACEETVRLLGARTVSAAGARGLLSPGRSCPCCVLPRKLRDGAARPARSEPGRGIQRGQWGGGGLRKPQWAAPQRAQGPRAQPAQTPDCQGPGRGPASQRWGWGP